LYENWESRSALEQHKATPHFGRLQKAVGELLIEPFEVNVLRAILPGTTAA
jgi:quinol monooxygenase YgiN